MLISYLPICVQVIGVDVHEARMWYSCDSSERSMGWKVLESNNHRGENQEEEEVTTREKRKRREEKRKRTREKKRRTEENEGEDVQLI